MKSQVAAARVERRVALYVPVYFEPFWTEALYNGIFRYARSVGGWRFGLFTDPVADPVLAWEPDGIIADITSRTAADALAAWGRPVVDIGYEIETGLARVRFDDRAVGRVAAEYLIGCGFRRFGVAAVGESPWDQERQEGYRARLAEAGYAAEVAPPFLFTTYARRPRAHTPGQEEWLARLGPGAAVFTTIDAGAFEVVEACRAAGLRVPTDVAVLGGGGDNVRCNMTDPPLSSVRCPEEAVGFEAARVLDRLFMGQPPGERAALPPIDIATRGSTDAAAVADADLAAALRYMRDHVGDRIGVDDVVAACGLSRSTLERRMRAAIGRSPLEELTRLRVELAARLLAETRAGIAVVARQVGFAKPSQLAAAFGRFRGCTPSAFRKRCS